MKKQSGFTLIELMIAGFIGIFILTGLMNLFITTNKSVTLSDSLSQNQETGRFAMDYLTRFIRRAGYTEDPTRFTPPIYISSGSGIDAITCTGNQADACSLNNPTVAPVTTLGDRLSIPMDISGNPGDEIRSCTGTIVGGNGAWANSGTQRIVNVFWVSSLPDNIRELRCRTFSRNTNNWIDQAVTIINNVERFEFQLGISKSKDDKFTARYVSLDTIENDPNLNLNFVRSIRIAILTTSEDAIDQKAQSTLRDRTYNLLDAPVFTIKDSNLRNIFTNTIELPNMIADAGL
jgi:type IV pilus assembly protein PilW